LASLFDDFEASDLNSGGLGNLFQLGSVLPEQDQILLGSRIFVAGESFLKFVKVDFFFLVGFLGQVLHGLLRDVIELEDESSGEPADTAEDSGKSDEIEHVAAAGTGPRQEPSTRTTDNG